MVMVMVMVMGDNEIDGMMMILCLSYWEENWKIVTSLEGTMMPRSIDWEKEESVARNIRIQGRGLADMLAGGLHSR